MGNQADLIIVGGGIMGAPAAYFAALDGANVVVVAAPEPDTPDPGNRVFGAHYDQTRLLWRWHEDDVATALAERSLSILQQIEVDGPALTRPTGVLSMAAPGRAGSRLARAQRPDAPFGVEPLDAAAIQRRWPQLRVPDEVVGFFEPGPSGWLDPRAVVAGFLQRSGAEIVSDEATGIEVLPRGVTVHTAQGERLHSRSVLVAAGAFTNRPGLLDRALRLRLKTETVVFAEIGPAQAAKYAQVPPIHYDNEPGEVAEIYTTPPVESAAGRWRLKLGANTTRDHWLAGTDAAADWYRNQPGVATPLKFLRDAMLELYPGLESTVWTTERCVITYTAHGHPYIDTVVPDRVFVAAGGNGGAAKLGPALGHVAARLSLEGTWSSDLPADWFRAVYEREAGRWAGPELLADRRRSAAADQG